MIKLKCCVFINIISVYLGRVSFSSLYQYVRGLDPSLNPLPINDTILINKQESLWNSTNDIIIGRKILPKAVMANMSRITSGFPEWALRWVMLSGSSKQITADPTRSDLYVHDLFSYSLGLMILIVGSRLIYSARISLYEVLLALKSLNRTKRTPHAGQQEQHGADDRTSESATSMAGRESGPKAFSSESERTGLIGRLLLVMRAGPAFLFWVLDIIQSVSIMVPFLNQFSVIFCLFLTYVPFISSFFL